MPTEKTMYLCDICGKEFDNKRDCRTYELMCGKEEVIKLLKFYDNNMKPIEVTPDNTRDMYYCDVGSIEAAELLHYWGCVKNYSTPFDNNFWPGVGIYYYDDRWKNLDEELAKLAEIKKILVDES